ncbi:hypothetical protein ACFX2F_025868 [Malus domestica]
MATVVVTSFSLFRNCVTTTVRAFVTVKAFNTNFTTSLLPLHYRRSLCHVSATNNEEAAAKAPVHVLVIPKLRDGLTGLGKIWVKNQQPMNSRFNLSVPDASGSGPHMEHSETRFNLGVLRIVIYNYEVDG